MTAQLLATPIDVGRKQQTEHLARLVVTAAKRRHDCPFDKPETPASTADLDVLIDVKQSAA